MAEKTQAANAEDIQIDGSSEVQYADVYGVKIRLARPMELDFRWVGAKRVVDQLKSCWFNSGDGEVAMSPRLVGKPGVGKTVLAYSAGKTLGCPVFLFQATSDTKPNDVLINPVVVENERGESKVEYVASTLVTAMIVGGVIVFDEGNRMQEKAWAALAPLLDSRRYIESVTAGVMIKAHRDFRFVATMNDDASCFALPEYIKSRLQPTIIIDNPERSEERRILEVNLPHANPVVLDYVADFLQAAHGNDENYTVREGIHIANYAGKQLAYEQYCGRELDPGDAVILAVEQVLGVRQARYIKQILWRERENSAA